MHCCSNTLVFQTLLSSAASGPPKHMSLWGGGISYAKNDHAITFLNLSLVYIYGFTCLSLRYVMVPSDPTSVTCIQGHAIAAET